MPTGLIKEAIYNYQTNTGIMLFPDEAGLSPLPAVTQLTIDPGMGQPPIVTIWSFINEDETNHNYLGYGGQLGVEWSTDSDTLYGLLDTDYVYQTVESQAAVSEDGNAITTIYTYNNYHLLLSTLTIQGDNTHQVETTYYAVPGKDFDQQPAQFQFPTLQTESWTDSTGQSFQQLTGFIYDEYGNLTRQTSLCDDKGQPTDQSTVIDSVYYSADGENTSSDQATGCPADPSGFVRWLKSQITTPPVIDGYDDVPVRTAYYRYQQQSTLSDMLQPYAILPAQETHTGSDVPSPSGRLLVRAMSYEQDITSPDYGRPTQQQSTVYNTDDATGSDSYTQTLDTVWQTDGDALLQTDTLTTHDKHTLTSSLSRSRFTHQLWSVTDSLNNKTEMTYDLLGRLKNKIRNKDTEYQSIRELSYTLDVTNGIVSAIYTTQTDDKGNGTRTYHDGMGRPITHQRNANDAGQPDTWCDTSILFWDAWGRLSSQANRDYPDPTDITNYFGICGQAKFDDWGQQTLSILSSGQNLYHNWDPINRYSVSQLQVADDSLHLGSSRVEYDVRDFPVKEIILDKNGNEYATFIREYDGLGRLRKEIDPMQNETTFTYDPFDRMAHKTLPDGTVQEWTYAPFTHAELPVTVSLDGQIMGTQTFDGLGRIKESACGGRTESATYSDPNTVPDTTTDACQQVLNYTYIKELNNALYSMTGTYLAQSFGYDNSTGQLLSASEDGSQSETLTWWPSGVQQGEVFTTATGNVRQTGYTWTLQGRPLSYQDITGNTFCITYDDYGRLKTLTDPQVSVNLTLDAASRLVTQETVSLNSDDTLTITLTLDDYNREIQRDIAPSSGDVLSIVQTYYENSQLAGRITSLGTDTP